MVRLSYIIIVIMGILSCFPCLCNIQRGSMKCSVHVITLGVIPDLDTKLALETAIDEIVLPFS